MECRSVGVADPYFLPYRQLSRLIAENGANITKELLLRFPGDYTRGLIYLLLARLCVDDWHVDGQPVVPRRRSAYFTTHSLAVTLSCPPETVRRHVNALIGGGWLVHDGGVALSSQGDRADANLGLYIFMHDLMVRTIAEVSETTDLVVTVAPDRRVLPVDVTRSSLDQSLVPLSSERMYARDKVLIALWGALNALNIRAVTYDRAVARRYAIDSSPDHVRRPVTLRRLAQTLALPYATVWRYMQRMETAGLVTHVGEGWVVLTANLRTEAIENRLILNMSYFARKLRGLGALGFDPKTARTHYLGEEPGLIW